MKVNGLVGKTYPKTNIPEYVSNARQEKLCIPQEISSQLPKPDLPIVTFLAMNLPEESKCLNSVKASAWFSKAPPTTDGPLLLQREIPSGEILGQLEKMFSQRWFDGCRSIVDPRLMGIRVRQHRRCFKYCRASF